MTAISATPELSIVIEDVLAVVAVCYQMTERSDKQGQVGPRQTGHHTRVTDNE